jgi:hypothetical protein
MKHLIEGFEYDEETRTITKNRLIEVFDCIAVGDNDYDEDTRRTNLVIPRYFRGGYTIMAVKDDNAPAETLLDGLVKPEDLDDYPDDEPDDPESWFPSWQKPSDEAIEYFRALTLSRGNVIPW